MESFIVMSLFASSEGVKRRNAELITDVHFIKAAEERGKKPLKKSSCSTKVVPENSENSSKIETLSDDSEDLPTAKYLSNTTDVLFAIETLSYIIQNVPIERLYVIGYYDITRINLFIGKVNSIHERNKVIVDFMDKKPNNKFIWKSNPKREIIDLEQLIIGPLSVQHKNGIVVNGLAKARLGYIKYVKEE